MARKKTVTILTGATIPTTNPSGIPTQVAPYLQSGSGGVAVRIVVASLADTFWLIGWDGAVWSRIGASITATFATRADWFERFSPGNNFSHFAVWREGGTVTPSSVILYTGVQY